MFSVFILFCERISTRSSSLVDFTVTQLLFVEVLHDRVVFNANINVVLN